MDEGSAILHHIERRINHALTCLVTHGQLSPKHVKENKEDTICILGTNGDLLTTLKYKLSALIETWSITPYFVQPIILDYDMKDTFYGSRHIILCIDRLEILSLRTQCLVGLACRLAKLRKGNILVVFTTEENNFDVETQPTRFSLEPIFQANPELRYLRAKGRVHNIRRSGNEAKILQNVTDVIRLWVQEKLPNDIDSNEYMDYTDLCQMVVRDTRQMLPDFKVFIRLLLMSLGGAFSVILTLLILVLVSKDTEFSKDIEKSCHHLHNYIINQRTGKSEWPWTQAPLAIFSLQMYDSSWCFASMENQRSIDRLEISLLAKLSRLKYTESRDLTPSKLSSYINALWVTYQNPRDFYGHDLVVILDKYLSQKAAFMELNCYSQSWAIIALCNTGYPVPDRYFTRILDKQKTDGSFPYGLDETAMAVISLSCASSTLDSTNATRNALRYIYTQRRKDGSYGNIYTTSLVMQAFNGTEGLLTRKQYEQTMAWLSRQSKYDPSARSIEVAAQVLITMSGKTMLSARNVTGFSRKKKPIDATIRTTNIGDDTEAYQYLVPDISSKGGKIVPSGITEKYRDLVAEAYDKRNKNIENKDNVHVGNDTDDIQHVPSNTSSLLNETSPATGTNETETHQNNESKVSDQNEELAGIDNQNTERIKRKREEMKTFILKKSHMRFSGRESLDVESLIDDEMEDDSFVADTLKKYAKQAYNAKSSKGKNLLPRPRKHKFVCCRTVNVFSPEYVLFNMCPTLL